MSFHIGQLVVCVDDTLRPPRYQGAGFEWRYDLNGLTRGTIYTIRDFEHRVPYEGDIRLVEIVRPICSFGFEAAYRIDRFRPLDDTKLSIFRDMLAPLGKETERA